MVLMLKVSELWKSSKRLKVSHTAVAFIVHICTIYILRKHNSFPFLEGSRPEQCTVRYTADASLNDTDRRNLSGDLSMLVNIGKKFFKFFYTLSCEPKMYIFLESSHLHRPWAFQIGYSEKMVLWQVCKYCKFYLQHLTSFSRYILRL